MSITSLFILAVLIILSAIFSGSETAIFSLTDARILALKKSKTRGARTLAKLRKTPQRLLIAILIGNNVANISASAIATYIITRSFGSLGIGIATGILTFLILVFGEIIPKSFAYTKAVKISLIMAYPLYIFSIILSPLIIFLEYITNITIKILGRKPDKRVTAAEIQSMIMLGAKEGILKENEEQMLKGIFKLKETEVKKIMTPRSKVVGVEKNVMIGDVISKAVRSGYSRFPIYNRSIDGIVGVVHIKELLSHAQKQWISDPIKKVMSRPIFVYESKDIYSLLSDLRKLNKHMAIVLTKNKKVSGIVTIEDILEEIVGEIYDEADVRRTKN